MKKTAPWKKRAPALWRWLDIFFMSVVATALVGIIFSLNASLLHRFLGASLWQVLAGIVLLVAFVCHGAAGRICAYFGFRHFRRYPPVWVAGVFGTVCILLGLVFCADDHTLFAIPADLAGPPLCCISALLALLLLVAAVVGAMFECKRSLSAQVEEPPSGPHEPLHDSWERLRQWIRSDDPVTDPRDDVFGHLPVARRIARRLRERPIPAQAVVGRLGSGKTTLRRLVGQQLGAESRTTLLSVELWPYENATSAVQGVLRTLLAGVSQEVNVTASSALPAQYAAVVGAAGNLTSAVAHLATGVQDPLAILETIDDIATTIDHRFVVWVEDLERFAGSAAGDESLEHSLRLAPLRALLSGLSQGTSISVVTATTQLHARFDTEKIARFVEHLPLLDPADAAKILQAFREGCRKLPFIDPAAAHTRRRWAGLNDGDGRWEALRAFGGNNYSDEQAAAALCRTPRSLKLALRHTLSAWTDLAGELDFDDMLLMHLLREAEPAAFAVVERHWHGLVGSHPIEREHKAGPEESNAALEALK
ncbi:MAG: hypothetical protein RJA70_1867, partial [Pseudomonadota bacterium]